MSSDKHQKYNTGSRVGLFFNQSKTLFLLLVITLVLYAASLLNGFVGDDSVIIVKNNFYSSIGNLRYLIMPLEYETKLFDVNSGLEGNWGSGSVGYRPILSLTYFLDHVLWGQNPFGYHLTNLILHVLNVLLLYIVMASFFLNTRWAFWTAVLFSVHPVQTEAVCAIGYRGDLLAAFFVLVALLGWITFRRENKFWGFWLATASYFFALFSKESAFFLPVVLGVYDFLWGQYEAGKGRYIQTHGLLVFVSLFYVILYLWVFPNPVLSASYVLLGGSWATHIAVFFQILNKYILSFCLPFTVTSIPGLYYPTPMSLWSPPVLATALLLVLGVLWSLRSFLSRKAAFFWVVLGGCFYIPASGLVPTPNPMAYRFLYLPAIAVCAGLGYCLFLLEQTKMVQLNIKMRKIFIGALLAVCVITSFFNIQMWKSNFFMGMAWVKEYPDFFKGNSVLGYEYFNKRLFYSAARYLEAALADKRVRDAQGNMLLLGYSYWAIGKQAMAESMFRRIICEYPWFPNSYQALAEMLLQKGEYRKARVLLWEAVRLLPRDDLFKILIPVESKLGGSIAVRRVLDYARKVLSLNEYNQMSKTTAFQQEF